MNTGDIQCLLWDFGDTLCDERFIWGSGPQWIELFRNYQNDNLFFEWDTGKLTTAEFAQTLAGRLGSTPHDVIAHMHHCCQAIQFYQTTYAFFKSRHLPQAIVTVNPDLFTEVIVPVCGLDQHCDAIVTSWEEGTTDKRILNRIAIDRLNMTCRNNHALLIDNKQLNIDRWRGIGGAGYLYSNDTAFGKATTGGADSINNLARLHSHPSNG